ncbi:MAG: efflux RND transporter permease subunit [Fidelibacterota bacterium]
MKSIIKPFIKYPILGNIIIVAVFLFGFLGYKSILTTFFPLRPSQTIMINAFYPGASPEEMEEGIVLKIEDNLKGLTGVERVTSTSSENSANIVVRIQTGYDINVLLTDVKNKVDQISTFPAGVERIMVYRREPFNFAIDFVLTGDVELLELKKNARKIERDLLSIDGISKISLSGFPDEEIEVAVREDDLDSYNMTFNELVNAVSRNNIKVTGGKIKGSEEELLIRANLKGYYAEELNNHVVRSSDEGAIVYLKDVAEVRDKWAEDPNRVYYNGIPAVRVSIDNTNEEDLFFVTETVLDYLDKFNGDHDHVHAHVIRDGSEIIQERIDILSGNGLVGIILVVLFLSLSLNPHMSFWVALGIPISFAGMLMIGPMYGLTINVMSLLGMILVLGILVDDGIVVAENIFQHHERGEKAIDAAINGTLEVLPSVIASVLTTVVIFATFFFLEGGMGDFTQDLAFVVIATLLMSLVEAAFILPSHIAHSKALCKKDRKKNIIERTSDRVLNFTKEKIYGPTLRFSIKHPAITVAVPVALVLITLGGLRGGIIKLTFFPYIEGRNVSVAMELPAGTPVNKTEAIMEKIEAGVWEVNELYKEEFDTEDDLVTAVSRTIGGGTHQGYLRVTLISSEKRPLTSKEISSRFRQQVGPIPEAQKLEYGGGGRWGKPVSIALKSNNFEQLRDAKEDLKVELREIDKLKDVMDNDPPGLREVKLELKEKAYSLGLSTSEVVNQVRSGFFGGQAQRLIRGIDEIKIWVRYDMKDRSSVQDLENMRIRTESGLEIPLEEIADFEIERGVMSINHIDGQRVVNVEADVANPNVSVPDILSDVEKNIMPGILEKYPEIMYSFEGENYENEKTINSIMAIVPAILILMFLIVSITFRSFTQAAIVFVLIPFSFVGVLWGHVVQGLMMSIISWFGAIALMGIVVNDSLVLVSAFNNRLKEGMSFYDAIYESGLSRLRPVLLTSLTTIAGLSPLIFESSHQAQFLSPMAVSVAYGLLFGTVLTLVMLPSLLVANNRVRYLFRRYILKQDVTPELLEPAVIEDKFVENQSEETC